MGKHSDLIVQLEKKLARIKLIERANQTSPQYSRSKGDDFLSAGPEFEELSFNLSETTLETKALAYYLPQFYPFKENNEWWGNGFTEWTNVTRARSRYDGHYQPHLPRDLGYYDLRNSDTIQQQAQMAAKAGLYGWCFYYYRFGNKRLLDAPINAFLKRQDINFKFCLMWANENWTRTWDGLEQNILMAQDYDQHHDQEFVDDLARHFNDPRYIRINGDPLYFIYRPKLIPNAKQRIEHWRELLLTRHNTNVQFYMAQIHGDKDPRAYGLDGAIEFPPHKMARQNDVVTEHLQNRDPEFKGTAVSYEAVMSNSLNLAPPSYPLIKTAAPTWDNEARKPNNGVGFVGSSPQRYQAWIEGLIDYAKANPIRGERFICINAWNEWAEGAHLEPDMYYGSAYLNATARALEPK